MFCEKKAVDNRQKEQLKISIRRLTQGSNLSFGTIQLILKKDLHFFPHRVSVVYEIKPLDNKSPHKITSLNIDRWIDL
jgi:hypothetical protein